MVETRNFGRVKRIKAGRAEFDQEKAEIAGKIPFTDTWKDDVTRIRVFNLSRATISQMAEADSIQIFGGFEGNSGTLFEGVIRSMGTTEVRNDRITKLQLGTGTSFFLNTFISRTYAGEVQPERILRDIIDEIPQIEEGRIDGLGVGTYPKKTISRDAFSEVEGIVRDFPFIRAYIREFQLFFETVLRFVPGRRAIVGQETGLLGVRRGFDRDLKMETVEIRSQLNRNIFTGGTVELRDTNADGTYRVIGGHHDLTEHSTTADLIEVDSSVQA